ncbi:MAG: DUF3120 domain-containing protein, partial [Cyanothece sp. SIO1E1]|nr:DUF3120 domain-containing protein [Cyanothece sp. SIO1E1]
MLPSSYTPNSPVFHSTDFQGLSDLSIWKFKISQNWLIFIGAVFLITVPIFLQAPLVRYLPWVSLVMTLGWLGLSLLLLANPLMRIWGDLLLGFTWIWLAGSIYWGWLRFAPLWHLPIEAI